MNLDELKFEIEKITVQRSPGEYYGIAKLLVVMEPLLNQASSDVLDQVFYRLNLLEKHPKDVPVKMMGRWGKV